MKYIIDIDGTICTQQKSGEYHLAEPYADRIKLINDLHDNGHEIVYWTARGMSSGLNHDELTQQQLDEWGCKRTTLMMNKPTYDVWVDDKSKWLFE
jgi:phosphatidate phosphatase PAH1